MEDISVIHILLVDDHPVVRQGLAAIIGTQKDMMVVGEAESGEEAIAIFAAKKPDVTLMDLRLPDMSGIDVAGRLHATWPQARIMMFTSFAREEEIHDALKAGALSYIRKGALPSELLEAVRVVHAGKRHVSPEMARHLAAHVAHCDLTPREHEVLQQILEGKSNKEIAGALGISEQTVPVHVKNLLNKLGVGSRTEAVTQGLRRGLLHLDS
jgi:DNA-binding NarL/FixJ family response regulator